MVDALVDRGELESAEATLQAAGLGGEVPEFFMALFVPPARARLRIALGRFDDALADLRWLRERTRVWTGADPHVHPYRALMVEALVRLGELDEARAIAAEEQALAAQWGTPRAIGIALRSQGLAAGGEEGIALLRESAAELGRAEAPLELARTLVELGSALRRAGSRSEAREQLRSAIDLASAHGAGGIVTRATEEIEAAGGRLRRERTIGVDSLTPSELRVARLAADGLSNRDIAAQLFLSTKTVEMHLNRVYRKLDIARRTELRQVELEK
jgi:DNA-binding NarL/FixJ family response regulator